MRQKIKQMLKGILTQTRNSFVQLISRLAISHKFELVLSINLQQKTAKLFFWYEIYPQRTISPIFGLFLTIKRVLYSSMCSHCAVICCILCSFICIYNTCALEAANNMPPPPPKKKS